jgi:NTE family protein
VSTEPDGPIALVLAGGGARAPYEVGALSVLLPELANRRELPSIILGTSAGAINAAWLAAHAHLKPDAFLDEALTAWRDIRFKDVLKPLVTPRAAARIGRYLLGAAFGHGRLDALLDPSPLPATLTDLICFDDIADNVEAGLVTVGVAATASRTGRTVVFVAGRGDIPGEDVARGIEYVRTDKLTVTHVLASAAIPTAFPAVLVEDGAKPGWYVDGGTRLNTPIKPAIALGASRLVVIGLNGTQADERDRGTVEKRPDAFDGAAQIVQGLLADPLAADIRTLASTNEMLRHGPRATAPHRAPKPYIFVAPERRDSIGEIARGVYLEHFAKWSFCASDRDLRLLGRLVGAGQTDMHGELFSYLCFARELAEKLIERGQCDAKRWLDQKHDDGPWRLGRLPGEAPAPRVP